MTAFLLDTHREPSVDRAALVARVDARLAEVLAEEAAHWRPRDQRFGELVALLADYVLEGGKRLRPTFCLLGHAGAGGAPDDPAALDAAAGLELLHAFALLHDDVMDGSELRRGRPAMHRRLADRHARNGGRGESRRYGDGAAILVGDLAFAYADRLLTAAGPAARSVWDELRIELTMGQFLDVDGAAHGGVDLPTARRIALHKSGRYTVTRPLQLGAAIAGAFERLGAFYEAFGDPLGEAFQLRDDLLGAFGDEAVTGKPVGDDLREGKPTVLMALARRRADAAQSRVLDRVGDPDLDADGVAAVLAVLEATGARAEVEHRIEQASDRALDVLSFAPVPEPVAAELADLVRACTERTS